MTEGSQTAGGVAPPAPAPGLDVDVLLRALDATDQALCVTDMALADEPIVYVNAAFTAMTGYPAEATLGRNCRFLQTGLDVAKQAAAIRRLLAEGAAGVVTMPNRRADGSVFVNELSLAPVTDADGLVTHYVGVQRDVTARVEAEQARDSLRAENDAIAEQLQQHLVPSTLPVVAGYDVAVRYRPAVRPDGSRGQVSGDFYDLVQRHDGAWYAVVGDVSGRGPRAAAVTATLRWSARGAAGSTAGPAELLTTVGTAVQDLLGERFATLVAVELPPVEPRDLGAHGLRPARVALAGHPQPVHLPAAGPPRLVGRPGSLVGPFPVEADDVPVLLGPGDLLVLYTDGVTEAHGGDGRMLDDEGLLAALAAVPPSARGGPSGARTVADALVATVDRHLRGSPSDDLLVLVVARR